MSFQPLAGMLDGVPALRSAGVSAGAIWQAPAGADAGSVQNDAQFSSASAAFSMARSPSSSATARIAISASVIQSARNKSELIASEEKRIGGVFRSLGGKRVENDPEFERAARSVSLGADCTSDGATGPGGTPRSAPSIHARVSDGVASPLS